MDLDYNTRILAATGQSPDARFGDGLPPDQQARLPPPTLHPARSSPQPVERIFTRDDSQLCCTAAVGARCTVGWRRWRSIGRACRYRGAAVGARCTVGQRPRRWRSSGRARCCCARRCYCAAVRGRHLGAMVPMPAQVCRSRRSPLRRRSWHSACPLTADRAAQRPEQWRTRPAILSTAPANPLHGATFPRLFGATSGNATEDAAVIAIRSPGVAAPLPICCRSTTCYRSPKGVARSRTISSYRALLITACATATGRLRRRSPRCSASSALLPRRSTALADGLQVARAGTHFASSGAERASSPPPHQTLAGRCRCAPARRCRSLP